MKAPVDLVCVKCKNRVRKGEEITRVTDSPATYAHPLCVKPKPVPTPPKPVPLPPTPKNVPKGWSTEDTFALPADALRRLHGQGSPDSCEVATAVDSETQIADPDAADGRGDEEGREQGEGEGDNGSDGERCDRNDGTGESGDSGEGEESESDGDEEGDQTGDGSEGEEEGEGDSEGCGESSEDREGEEEGSDGGDEEGESEGERDGDDGEEKDGEQEPQEGGEKPEEKEPNQSDKGKKQQPPKPKPKGKDDKSGRQPAEPKQEKTGKLEDLPDSLLLRLAQLAAQMAEGRVKAAIEPRLAEILMNTAEPLTAKMASEFQAKMGDSVRAELIRAVTETRAGAETMVKELQREIDKRVADEIKRLDGLRPVVHKIEKPDGTGYEFPKSEMFHYAFDEVLKLAGAGFDCFLPGPTGCGKTHISEQIAKALSLDYAMVSGTGGTTETELLGYSNPNITTGESVYHPTGFVRVYEGGGLFLLDEADAMDANALLKVNAAIANGFCPLPKRAANPVMKRHPNFVFMMAANTWGHGATRMYCGRNKLDEATLDRFRAGTVPMDYDPVIERRLVGDPELYKTLAEWRQKIRNHNLQRVLSTRFMIHAKKLKAIGYTIEQVGAKLCGGWTASDIERVMN